MDWRKYLLRASCFMLFWLIFGHMPLLHASDTKGVSKISVDQVKQFLGQPDTIIIDVRTPRNWWRSGKKILTAIREDPSKVDQWFKKYTKDQTLIFYCS
jgi:hypothetical protein